MCNFTRALLLAYVVVVVELQNLLEPQQYLEPKCGSYGFVCVGPRRLRLCRRKYMEMTVIMGPGFLCPRGLQCNEQWSQMCINYAAPWLPDAKIHCRRGKRVPNPSVPDCKGYILCIPVGDSLRAIHFNCNGDSVFNPRTRTCSAPDAYRCPAGGQQEAALSLIPGEPVFCFDFKQNASAEQNDFDVQYFCPKSLPANGPLLCTVHSVDFCLTLERDDVDLSRHTTRHPLSTPALPTPSLFTTYAPSVTSQAFSVQRRELAFSRSWHSFHVYLFLCLFIDL